eukprot:CAMPEP_0119322392 /NCGR_PEP_ID=MMETSP1333-20130426/58069_1 /TAXON_ID=418940 /ORGANISM="Scyphosphaera apsteinii, Strain RCC1455" /LENGTH=244 /DNA_ID=CAMNT_0007329617 /DNA_START=185 /DNA_END=920 /DNA_ORIENTATION=-
MPWTAPASATPVGIDEPCVSRSYVASSCSPFCDLQQSPAVHSNTAVPNCEADWTRGKIWSGGDLLARLLLETPQLVTGRRVLELGSGTGVAGLAAAVAGAKKVLLTDQTISQARDNVLLNPSIAPLIELRELSWGSAQVEEIALLSWHVVLAADCVYPTSTTALPALLDTVHNTIGVNGMALLTYIERSVRVTRTLQVAMREFGFACERRALRHKAWLYILRRPINSTGRVYACFSPDGGSESY